jgi:8-oxo-dGTP pyrophosphatase MutT (NUDIX family)
MMEGLQRHVAAAHRLRLPGRYTPLQFADAPVGFVLPDVAGHLTALGASSIGGAITLPNQAALAEAESALARAGRFRPRGELFDVRAAPGGPVLAHLDRGALPVLGIAAEGVHVNGLVQTPHGLHLWVGKRAATKPLDPGKLDHIVAGGISAGMNATETLVKEAAEEAGIPADVARQAKLAGIVTYAIERHEGLRRDHLHCFDLVLPADFHPIPRDGEVESFSLIPVQDVLKRVADTDDFKFNVNLVLIDLFIRLGLVREGSLPPAGGALPLHPIGAWGPKPPS